MTPTAFLVPELTAFIAVEVANDIVGARARSPMLHWAAS